MSLLRGAHAAQEIRRQRQSDPAGGIPAGSLEVTWEVESLEGYLVGLKFSGGSRCRRRSRRPPWDSWYRNPPPVHARTSNQSRAGHEAERSGPRGWLG